MKTIKNFILNMNDISQAVKDFLMLEIDDPDTAVVTFRFCDSEGNIINPVDENGKPISVNAICTVTEDD